MAVDQLKNKEVPWCTVFLVVMAVLCHSLVLVGNYQTASAMETIGSSTGGWSKVGLGLSRSFHTELDHQILSVNTELLAGMKQILLAQSMIDKVLTLIGGVADNATAPESLKLLQIGDPHATASSLLEAQATRVAEQAAKPSAIAPLVIEGFEEAAKAGIDAIKHAALQLVELIKPTLEKVGKLITKFGTKIQGFLSTFSSSLDKVQKVFDQIMARLNGGGKNEDLMIQQTFHLFDASATGAVSAQDLESVSSMYSISALAGNKPQELTTKYDEDGDGQLSVTEFRHLVRDPAIPNVMALVLRTYARRLSEVAGLVEQARMRSEVASALVQYLTLVCAKNMTKVGWVSDTLGNASLPMAFTGDVMIQMCLASDDPTALSSKDVGATVVATMYRLHPEYTVKCINQLANTQFWVSEGFNPLDQPRCLKMATGWVAKAKMQSLAQLSHDSDDQMRKATLDARVLNTMPMVAEELASGNLNNYLADSFARRAEHRAHLYSSTTSRLLLDRLFGGVAATDGATGGTSVAARAIAGGVPAKPETLRFAKWLANNATTNANIFQGYCFTYTSQSSTSTDTFATQIESMIKKIQSFITMMLKYTTPAGIQKIEDTVMGVVDSGLDEILEIVMSKVEPLINRTVPVVEQAVQKAVRAVEQTTGLHVSSTASKAIGEEAGKLTSDVLGSKVGHVVEGIVEAALDGEADKPQGSTALVAQGRGVTTFGEQARPSSSGSRAEVSTGQFDQLTTLLRQITSLIPVATQTLTFARTEISKASKNMASIFTMFETKGPAIFDNIAVYWRLLWTLYFFFLAPMTCILLFYGFWAGGYCGGPQPLPEEGEHEVEPPSGFAAKMCVCCSSCCTCLTKFHDSALCFWSFILLMQVIVLLIFVISIVLCVVAGVKAFVTSSCAQIYMLGDVNICTSLLNNMKSFLASFHVLEIDEVMESICTEQALLTCSLISEKMKTSAMLTTVFSFVGTIFSLQMIIESAMLHEMAKYRRMANAVVAKEEREGGS